MAKFRERIFIFAVLFIAVFLAYLPALQAGYIWDDNDHLTENPHLEDIQGLKRIWTSFAGVYYPLVLTTFWFMRRLFGLHPLPYHLLNIFLHSLNAFLLWAILREMKIKGGIFAAFIFALHPVNVQSVAWVTELKNVQSGFFYLLTILTFLKFYKIYIQKSPENTPCSGGKWTWYGLSLFIYSLALLSKTSTVVLPAALILLIWWINRSYEIRRLLITIPYFILSLLGSAWTIGEQLLHSGATGAEWSQTFLERILIASRCLWFYLQKIIFPHPLVFIYPRWEVDHTKLLWYVPAAGMAVIFIILILKRKTSWGTPTLLVLLFFTATLFPMLGFFNMYIARYTYVADHFPYLAGIGPIILIGYGIAQLMEKMNSRKKPLAYLVPLALLVTLGILTSLQSRIYKNIETIWRDTIKKNPRCWLAHNNLGEQLSREGKMEEALKRFSKAYDLKHDYETACYNLGTYALRMGEYEKAADFFKQAIRANPDYPEAHNNLGNALSKMNRLGEAIDFYKEAIRIKPRYVDAWFNLGNTFFRMNKSDEAVENYRKALSINPYHADAHCNLGVVLIEMGRKEEGALHLKEALRIAPDHAVANQALQSLGK
ncbi:tetratricopeptide repeat protein [Candidatus Sumerlaeota bacterium]|nr:tetratricopeptide repeat protein [Candidatus Sumerlaeota bacterium]